MILSKISFTGIEGNTPLLSIILGCIQFTDNCIKFILDMVKFACAAAQLRRGLRSGGNSSYLNFVLTSLTFVKKESDSLCESIDEISKQEIEDSKKNLISKLTDIDYETYIKQFWVGLLEGDGTITVSTPGPKHIKVRIIISIKNLLRRENVIMLLLIQQVLGGTVRIERKAQYVSLIAIKKDLIQYLIGVLKKYPLLTTRKQCQLKFAAKCIKNFPKDFVVENRDFMYKDQNSMLDYYENNFVIPKYFPAWLSGFIEAEGNFRFLSDKRRNMQISGRFNIGQNF